MLTEVRACPSPGMPMSAPSTANTPTSTRIDHAAAHTTRTSRRARPTCTRCTAQPNPPACPAGPVLEPSAITTLPAVDVEDQARCSNCTVVVQHHARECAEDQLSRGRPTSGTGMSGREPASRSGAPVRAPWPAPTHQRRARPHHTSHDTASIGPSRRAQDGLACMEPGPRPARSAQLVDGRHPHYQAEVGPRSP
jgi:hypothetical protein